jgi:acetyl esterase
MYATKLRKSGVKVWDKCFAGQIHCLIGLPPDAAELREYESIVKSAMKASFSQ